MGMDGPDERADRGAHAHEYEQVSAPLDSVVARAQELWRRTAPVLRDVHDVLERHGGLHDIRDVIIDQAGHRTRRASEAAANAAAIEGIVVERDPPEQSETRSDPHPPRPDPAESQDDAPTHVPWIGMALVAGATVFGALISQRHHKHHHHHRSGRHRRRH